MSDTTQSLSDVSISIIVPTYEEAANMPELTQRIDAMRGQFKSIELLIVDDNSPDNTREVIAGLHLDWVRLIVRTTDRGLSSAVLHGLAQAKGDLLFVMDADLSHPPEAIEAMALALQQGADFTVGSRYVPGGSTEDGWGVLRWLNSKVATYMARPFTTVRDPMSGFLGMHRHTWASAVDLDPVGYKIGLELVVKCRCVHVVEVPIHFATRQRGQSKLSISVQLQYLLHIVRLMRWKFPGWSSFVPFAAVGASGMVVYVGLLAAIGALWPEAMTWQVAIPAAAGAMIWNFLLDRWLAFWYAPRGSLLRQCAGFVAICSVPVAINILITTWLAGDTMVTPLAGLIGSLVGSVAGVVFNWAMTRWLVFGSASA
jgi:dolichol-phosphate mannosyltransferase